MAVAAMEEMYEKMRQKSASSGSGSSKLPLVSGATAGAGPGKRKSLRQVGQEKKIAEDEFMAAAIGDVEWLKQSLRSGRGDIHYDKNGLAPIHLAAIYGRLDCLKLLIEKYKVDVNLPSTTGWRPLHLVISNSTGKRAFQCLTYLLGRGADPALENEDGITAIHQAASEGHVQCLKALMDTGASVDGQDYRGHRPIDLAKLWGHRKCARLLASEQWHQDKDFLSSEMKQLQKLKMQHILSEIEADEANKAHQEFYGNIAFNDWLQQHGLRKSPQVPPSAAKERANRKPPSAKREKTVPPSSGNSLSKPNSLREPTAGGSTSTPKEKTPVSTKEKRNETPPQSAPAVGQTKNSLAPNREFTSSTMKTEGSADSAVRGLHEPKSTTPPDSSSDQRPTNSTADGDTNGLYHPHRWNTSTKVPAIDYTPILDDHYPRDEYSMLPKHPPKRSPTLIDDMTSPTNGGGKSGTGAASQRKQDTEGGNKMPLLPSDVIAKTLKPGSYERPVVYKCKHIADLQSKLHVVDENRKPRSESGIHLTNDPSSHLFRSALLERQHEGAAGNFSKSDTVTLGGVYERKADGSDLAMMIKRMSKQSHYPKTSGPEYDINYGQLLAI